jgi:ketosteroid isomerase-like protein
MKGVLLSLALSAALAAPAGVAAKDAKAELAEAGAQWNALYAKGDWAAMRALYSDDAWLMTDKAPIALGADAIIAFLRRYRDQGATVTFRFENEDVRVDGKIGTVVARYWMTAQIPGRPEVRTAGRSLLIYRRESGKWKLWRDMDNTTPDVAVTR